MRALSLLQIAPFRARPHISFRSFATIAMASATAEAPRVLNAIANGDNNSQNRPPKRQNRGTTRVWNKKKTKREKNITEGSSEDVLKHDIDAIREARKADFFNSSGEQEEQLPQEGTETDVEVLEVSSTGDGLAMRAGSEHVYIVPFTVPGDTAKVKVFRHLRSEKQTLADFISITKPSPLRDDARIQCKYFASCGGCQFQMLEYPEQLRLKKRVLEKAYQNFSNLDPAIVPTIQDTIGSPLQYGYRTKLTPHFDGPPGFRPSKRGKNPDVPFPSCPDIGYMQKGRRQVLDIEDCPIGTSAVRLGMTRERERMQTDYVNYKRGATILLRENTQRFPKDSDEIPQELPPFAVRVENDTTVDIKSCITDSKATTTEYIGDYTFTNPAGSFFQNNNSILPTFTNYIRDRILPPSGDIKYLIDAYSGSGLFTITLSSLFQHSIGIDIAADSIAFAGRNARLNGMGQDRCEFIAADAGELFKSVGTYDRDQTVVVLDPPRKGCDASFLSQLRRFGPRRVLYVSCNVHTQARDVGVLVRGEGEGERYEIESLVGFDFFPQTGHVEGVAILNRVDS
ncbi:S-adenosyl-L-methionine-dependent methyltransferase [Thelonectria olida]|uniref:tRNA (uracil(54)-C(5))-methyltransferase n=1 Tax=Thelonectria olida TaxID=1576542 RepID=A0A9P8WG95_9HYPO|nr:S-adenosyl-L-methionine-dependent methyltransferase [Thelonectria olida]